MREQAAWFAARPEYEHWGLSLESDTEAYAGRLRKSRELTRRAAASAMRVDDKENVALGLDSAALREAAFGNSAEARQAASDALKQSQTSQAVEVEAALALATAGDTARAESLTHDLAKRFPLDTVVQSNWLPTIRAQLAITGKNPSAAIDVLEDASAIEMGQIDCFRSEHFLLVSDLRARRGISCCGRERYRRRRISENPRPQRNRLELFDWCAGASGPRSRLQAARRHRQSSHRLPGFLNALERRRSRHPHPETSQNGIREDTVIPRKRSFLSCRAPRFCRVRKVLFENSSRVRAHTKYRSAGPPFLIKIRLV